jgi:(1->4)-alpha-D-glucan 1-alpha-D-glucosylmutase
LDAFGDRVSAAMLKSSREAGVNTGWIRPNTRYEEALAAFVRRALDPEGRFLPSFRAFEAAVAGDAAAISLAQLVLKLTVPGVPDIYQGAELHEQSMVDPDNRRPVDFRLRREMLEGPPSPDATCAAAKFDATRRLLRLRRSSPRLFAEGSYQPLAVEGAEAGPVCAFARLDGEAGIVVAVALRGTGADVRIALPAGVRGGWSLVLGDGRADRRHAAVLRRGPVAVLHADGGTPSGTFGAPAA